MSVRNVKKRFGRATLNGFLGASLESVERGSVTISMRVSPEMKNSGGVLHGGATAALLDATAAATAWSVIADGETPMTRALSISYFRPVKSGTVRAVGEVVTKTGRALTLRARAFDRYHRLVAEALVWSSIR